MSGGKGGSSSSTVEIPQYLKAASQKNIGRAEDLQLMGQLPRSMIDVAGFSPMQKEAMKSQNAAAQAYGLVGADSDPLAGIMPETQTIDPDTGEVVMSGYSSFPLFSAALREAGALAPADMAKYNSLFVDNKNPQSAVGRPTGGAYYNPYGQYVPPNVSGVGNVDQDPYRYMGGPNERARLEEEAAAAALLAQQQEDAAGEANTETAATGLTDEQHANLLAWLHGNGGLRF
jgi:hypothetical protein